MLLKPKQMVELFICLTLGPCVYMLGRQLDAHVKQTEVTFRDKSARYGKDLKPGDPPSW